MLTHSARPSCLCSCLPSRPGCPRQTPAVDGESKHGVSSSVGQQAAAHTLQARGASGRRKHSFTVGRETPRSCQSENVSLLCKYYRNVSSHKSLTIPSLPTLAL